MNCLFSIEHAIWIENSIFKFELKGKAIDKWYRENLSTNSCFVYYRYICFTTILCVTVRQQQEFLISLRPSVYGQSIYGSKTLKGEWHHIKTTWSKWIRFFDLSCCVCVWAFRVCLFLFALLLFCVCHFNAVLLI